MWPLAFAGPNRGITLNTNMKRVVGTGADDQLAGSAFDDLIMGAAGSDVLLGLEGNDELIGGAGNDEVDGGRGSDLLSGGNGADLFVSSFGDLVSSIPPEGTTEGTIGLYLGDDVITDFELGVDHLQVRAGDNPVVLTAAFLSQVLKLTETDADGDGKLDTVIHVDYIDPVYGIHVTDPSSSITLLGVTGATVQDLFAG
jgi:Ca2+-binding RTX toxin-like protein